MNVAECGQIYCACAWSGEQHTCSWGWETRTWGNYERLWHSLRGTSASKERLLLYRLSSNTCKCYCIVSTVYKNFNGQLGWKSSCNTAQRKVTRRSQVHSDEFYRRRKNLTFSLFLCFKSTELHLDYKFTFFALRSLVIHYPLIHLLNNL